MSGPIGCPERTLWHRSRADPGADRGLGCGCPRSRPGRRDRAIRGERGAAHPSSSPTPQRAGATCSTGTTTATNALVVPECAVLLPADSLLHSADRLPRARTRGRSCRERASEACRMTDLVEAKWDCQSQNVNDLVLRLGASRAAVSWPDAGRPGGSPPSRSLARWRRSGPCPGRRGSRRRARQSRRPRRLPPPPSSRYRRRSPCPRCER